MWVTDTKNNLVNLSRATQIRITILGDDPPRVKVVAYFGSDDEATLWVGHEEGARIYLDRLLRILRAGVHLEPIG